MLRGAAIARARRCGYSVHDRARPASALPGRACGNFNLETRIDLYTVPVTGGTPVRISAGLPLVIR